MMLDNIPLQFVPKEVRPIIATLRAAPEIVAGVRALLDACFSEDEVTARRKLVALMLTIKRVGLKRIRKG